MSVGFLLFSRILGLTFVDLYDEIEVMRSLAKPRKISIRGSNGQSYVFLGKPKDDLRKDARLMDFNGIINKLLKANSESRRRKLCVFFLHVMREVTDSYLDIRTYGVVTLNEECGFIQWVSYTIPVRSVLVKMYENRGITGGGWVSHDSGFTSNGRFRGSLEHRVGACFWPDKGDRVSERGRGNISNRCPQAVRATHFPHFNAKNEPWYRFPPLFHNWFLETFPEPSVWLSSRLAYSRTAAVMSIIGFILG
jgi:serine/threonine-protein kinase ATR